MFHHLSTVPKSFEISYENPLSVRLASKSLIHLTIFSIIFFINFLIKIQDLQLTQYNFQVNSECVTIEPNGGVVDENQEEEEVNIDTDIDHVSDVRIKLFSGVYLK